MTPFPDSAASASSVMEWPPDILAKIWTGIRLDIHPGLKKRGWGLVHTELLDETRWNIVYRHAHRLHWEYNNTVIYEDDEDDEDDATIGLAPELTGFAIERWLLHCAYALPEGAVYWAGTFDDDEAVCTLPNTADANGLPIPELDSERNEVLNALERAWDNVVWLLT